MDIEQQGPQDIMPESARGSDSAFPPIEEPVSHVSVVARAGSLHDMDVWPARTSTAKMMGSGESSVGLEECLD